MEEDFFQIKHNDNYASIVVIEVPSIGKKIEMDIVTFEELAKNIQEFYKKYKKQQKKKK